MRTGSLLLKEGHIILVEVLLGLLGLLQGLDLAACDGGVSFLFLSKYSLSECENEPSLLAPPILMYVEMKESR